MRKSTPLWIMTILALALSGCSLSFGSKQAAGEPTLTDAQMQTQLSALLTAQPTATAAPTSEPSATATPPLPTVEVTQAPAEPTATLEAAVVQATDTPAATAEGAVSGESGAQAGGGGPTSTPPPTLTPQGPTATASANDPRSYLGDATSTDAMNDASAWTWPTGTNEFTSVDFRDGSMILTSIKNISGWRLANPAGKEFGNLYLEATVRTGPCKGNDQYGLIVRVPVLKDADQGYLFGFTCDGRYSFRTWDGKVGEKGKMTRLVDWTANKAINAGSNQNNRIGLMMKGTRMQMYANGVLLGEVTTNLYSGGYFGLFIGGIQTNNFAISVPEMSYWENPK